MKVFVVLLAALAVVARATDQHCAPQCHAIVGDRLELAFVYTPCTHEFTHVLAHDTVNNGTWTSAAATRVTCSESGSGAALIAFFKWGSISWMYEESNACVALRTATTDAQLTFIATSALIDGRTYAMDAPLSSSAVDCVQSGIALLLPAVQAAPVGCWSGDAVMRGTQRLVVQLLSWSFNVATSGALSVSIALNDSVVVDTLAPQLVCRTNLGTTLLQVADADAGQWALSWTYRSYASCDDLYAAVRVGADEPPAVESAVVVVPGDQIYSWERDADEQQVTTALSDRQVVCQSVPSPTLAPQPSFVPSGQVARPVVPFVQCVTTPATRGRCRAVLGYVNPNSWAVTLTPDTEANQLVRSFFVDHSPLPAQFEPGRHNNSLWVEYPCSSTGRPHLSWKLRTPVPVELAVQLDTNECARGCRPDLIHWMDQCSALAAAHAPATDGATRPVVRCARTDPAAHPECEDDNE